MEAELTMSHLMQEVQSKRASRTAETAWFWSTFLFPVPSPWYGLARLVDLTGKFTQFNVSASPREADARARMADLRAILEDFAVARTVAINQDQILNDVIAQLALAESAEPNRAHGARKRRGPGHRDEETDTAPEAKEVEVQAPSNDRDAAADES